MKSPEEDTLTIKVELDRFEEEKAVLFSEKGEEIILPRRMFPKSIKDGESLLLTIATAEAGTRKKEQKAKEILNEILNF